MYGLQMKLFGSFSLSNGTDTLGETMLHSKKLTKLLIYILIHRDSVLSHQKLIETFWEDKSKNPEGALKNLMHRLRTSQHVLGDDEFILTVPGAYRWNPKIPVETDYEQFEQLCQMLRNGGVDQDGKKTMCTRAMELCTGAVSPLVNDESWILPKATRYRSAYMDIAKMLCEIYEQEMDWSSLELVCNHALAVDSFDEDIHCWMLRSLNGQRKYDLAMHYYEVTSKLFYENMGVRMSQKLQNTFRELVRDTDETIADIEELLREAKETTKPEGAFFCDYQIFRQIYRMEARRISRVGLAEYLVLLTVTHERDGKEVGMTDSMLQDAMNILELLIRNMLRSGDVAARYSPTQFVIMLPTCSCESGKTVAERLRREFLKKIRRRRLDLRYELAEITPIEEHISRQREMPTE